MTGFPVFPNAPQQYDPAYFNQFMRMLAQYMLTEDPPVNFYYIGSTNAFWTSGSGAPTMAAPVGSIYSRTDGGPTTSLYSMTTGGWVAEGSGGGSPGPQGPSGFAFDGEEGAEGFPIPGVAGVTGSPGTQGQMGVAVLALDGEEGAEGFPIPGNQGIQGNTGLQGGAGVAVLALDGEEGPEGFPIPGATGAQGNTGLQGGAGVAVLALDGEEGAEGMPIPGIAGVAGSPGAQGQVGPVGVIMDGEEGAEGFPIPGPPGPSTAVPGLTIYTTQTTPLPSAGGAFTGVHSLGVVPSVVVLECICLTAELGYSINDVVQSDGYSTSAFPLELWKNSTAVGAQLPSTVNCAFQHKTTGVWTNPTLANWAYRFMVSTGTQGAQGAPGYGMVIMDGEEGAEGMPIPGSTSTAGLLGISAGLTANTTINDTVTYTTGGDTLAGQVAQNGARWEIEAWGTFVAVSSATARNAQIAPYWGATALPAITPAVLASVAQTTNWYAKFSLLASSTTAVWASGFLENKVDYPAIVAGTSAPDKLDLATPASTTVTAGAQTIDLRFSMSVAVATDQWVVQNVTIKRIK